MELNSKLGGKLFEVVLVEDMDFKQILKAAAYFWLLLESVQILCAFFNEHVFGFDIAYYADVVLCKAYLLHEDSLLLHVTLELSVFLP